MATTIQVTETTKQLLERLKEEDKAGSYDEVIQKVLLVREKVPKSMFGVDKGIVWKKEDRLKFREL